MIGLFVSLIIILALIYLIFAVHYQHHLTKFILKPATMTLIIVLAIFGSNLDSTFSKLVVVGLLFSVVGDIFLMLEEKWFVNGLISFFIAHVFYIVGLYKLVIFNVSNLLLSGIILLIVAAVFFTFLYASVKKEGGVNLSVAVALYITVISVMVWLAILTGSSVLIFAALLFYVSDAVLAVDKFKYPFRAAEYTIMFTYFLAQLLFALSINTNFI